MRYGVYGNISDNRWQTIHMAKSFYLKLEQHWWHGVQEIPTVRTLCGREVSWPSMGEEERIQRALAPEVWVCVEPDGPGVPLEQWKRETGLTPAPEEIVEIRHYRWCGNCRKTSGVYEPNPPSWEPMITHAPDVLVRYLEKSHAL